ncbi:GNAT family N-acetyltransferase [Phycicoccus sp. 3266]|uniref:GNAT family N-acetyltransferase n=1 Tax=Phycicoccus sp. 3266 TaxID=2817751 RepID=UPI00285A55F6|nr:GNAT family N-acetyltransferase [Phycicoccus sp. 3266]MDR6862399.1 8-oxo-dGTP pyrophosphatase MutT (NUDIX family)/GNAT superfamily N-acetyltransferase [Phycicoccus sp. 3266]
MPVPEFIVALRERVGTDLLWLSGVSAVVRNDRGEVLLVRRADNGQWALVSGILEPGEQPAEGLRREIEEETGVVATVDTLTGVWTLPPIEYPNGDRAQYLDLCFLATHVSGEARVNDDESLEVGWFAPDSLPPMMERSRVRLDRALAHDGRVWFLTGDASTGDAPTGDVSTGDVSTGDVPSDGQDGYAGRPARDEPLATLRDGDREVLVRRAHEADLAAIVHLLADDRLGVTREDEGDLTAYRRGLTAIDADPNQLLVVLDDDGDVVGTLQLTFIPGISHGGAWRAQVEGVRVATDRRGSGLGGQLMEWVAQESRRRGCRMVQLTTNKTRTDAHRFYERLGFVGSHEGYKLDLGARPAAVTDDVAP